MAEDLEYLFAPHPPTDDEKQKIQKIHDAARVYAAVINEVCPENWPKHSAVMHVAKSVLWANASILCGDKIHGPAE